MSKKIKFNNKLFIRYLFIGLFLFFVLLGTYIYLNTYTHNKVKAKPVKALSIIKTYDKNQMFYLGHNFEKLVKGTLNKESSLEAVDRKNNIFFVYMSAKKGNYKSFDDFSNRVFADNNKAYKNTMSKVEDITINKTPAKRQVTTMNKLQD